MEFHELENLEFMIMNADEHRPQMKSAVSGCNSCKAEFMLIAEGRLSMCPLCSHISTGEKTHDLVEQPLKILPFKITQQEAISSLISSVKRLSFSKNGFRATAMSSFRELVPLYLPYWNFTADLNIEYEGAKGHEKRSSSPGNSDVTNYTDYSPRKGEFDKELSWLLPASRSFDEFYLTQLEPWDLENAVEFSDRKALSGIAELPRIGKQDAWNTIAKKRAAEVERLVEKHIGGDKQKVYKVNCRYDRMVVRMYLLPVYVSTVMFRQKQYKFFH